MKKPNAFYAVTNVESNEIYAMCLDLESATLCAEFFSKHFQTSVSLARVAASRASSVLLAMYNNGTVLAR